MSQQAGVILSNEKLRTLAKLIQSQEEQRIMSIPFRSERDRGDYLRCSRETHDATIALLDKGADPLRRYMERNESRVNSDPDPPVEDVVQEFLGYLEIAAGSGMQIVKNVHLRHDFLGKVRDHADSLIPKMNELMDGPLEPWEIELRAKELIEELAVFKDAMYKSIVKKADPSSRNFSKVIKLSGNSFEELVLKYQKKLVREKGPEYDNQFELLEDEQKIEVYDEIIQASGRGTYLSNLAYKLADYVGKGLLMFTLAMSVWDIYTSEHKFQTIVTETAEFGAGWFGGWVGEIVGSAAATYLVTVVGVAETAVTAAFVGLAAFISGIGIGIGLGILAGYVVGKIFGSGGKHTGGAITIGEPKKPRVSTQEVNIYAAPMPDGTLLARQLAYQGAHKINNAVAAN